MQSVVRTVDSMVATAEASWWGSRGRAFVAEWRTVHRPALLRAAGSVEGLGRSALNNAHEQRDTSATTGATAGGGDRTARPTAAAASSGPWAFDDLSALVDSLGTPMAWAHFLAGVGHNANLVGRYSDDTLEVLGGLSKAARMFGAHLQPSDLYFKAWLDGPLTVNGPLDSLARSSAVKELGLLGTGVSLIGNALQLTDPNSDALHRTTAVTNSVADVMKAAGPPPVKLAGMVGSAAGIIAEEVPRVDWSLDGLASTVSFAAKNPHVVLEETGKAVFSVIPRVLF
ncbi:hypothetical protein KMZ32_18280 [Phycicoccus sp. MAQZ13P-2]|uniref:hypothetical protein n=1 Tax=Phycicoccus mangrovi TaxID=2840470 RepID=UPI001C002B4D|nr:hypothetical protein [Phycicoccus mangrovi]MBT9276026.1 hypothetical protein [Phycicoccus mangrovi]